MAVGAVFITHSVSDNKEVRQKTPGHTELISEPLLLRNFLGFSVRYMPVALSTVIETDEGV